MPFLHAPGGKRSTDVVKCKLFRLGLPFLCDALTAATGLASLIAHKFSFLC